MFLYQYLAFLDNSCHLLFWFLPQLCWECKQISNRSKQTESKHWRSWTFEARVEEEHIHKCQVWSAIQTGFVENFITVFVLKPIAMKSKGPEIRLKNGVKLPLMGLGKFLK